MKRNILIGNGINVNFGGPEYTNGKIIERVTENLELPNRYDEVFANKVSQQELQGVIKGINDIFNKMLNLSALALRNTETEDEMRTLIDISRRYKGKKYSLVEVGLEDYFFVLRWFNNHYNDGKDFDIAVFDGLKWIFLDAIYNDGKTESIYESMDGFKKELN